MSKVKEMAEKQARRHANEFFDENEWEDILDKYAEVANKSRNEIKQLREQEENGVNIEEEDRVDYYYYSTYAELLAHWIANTYLVKEGYEQDKNNDWILKKKRRFRR